MNKNYLYFLMLFVVSLYGMVEQRCQIAEEIDEKLCNQEQEGLLKGTLVKVPFGYARIEKLRVGDLVISRSEQGILETDTVVAVNRKTVTEVVFITIGDRAIVAADGHRFFTPLMKLWAKACNISPKDRFISFLSKEEAVKAVKVIQGKFDIVSLSIEKNHNFFVSERDLLVHNMWRSYFTSTGSSHDSGQPAPIDHSQMMGWLHDGSGATHHEHSHHEHHSHTESSHHEHSHHEHSGHEHHSHHEHVSDATIHIVGDHVGQSVASAPVAEVIGPVVASTETSQHEAAPAVSGNHESHVDLRGHDGDAITLSSIHATHDASPLPGATHIEYHSPNGYVTASLSISTGGQNGGQITGSHQTHEPVREPSSSAYDYLDYLPASDSTHVEHHANVPATNASVQNADGESYLSQGWNWISSWWNGSADVGQGTGAQASSVPATTPAAVPSAQEHETERQGGSVLSPGQGTATPQAVRLQHAEAPGRAAVDEGGAILESPTGMSSGVKAAAVVGTAAIALVSAPEVAAGAAVIGGAELIIAAGGGAELAIATGATFVMGAEIANRFDKYRSRSIQEDVDRRNRLDDLYYPGLTSLTDPSSSLGYLDLAAPTDDYFSDAETDDEDEFGVQEALKPTESINSFLKHKQGPHVQRPEKAEQRGNGGSGSGSGGPGDEDKKEKDKGKDKAEETGRKVLTNAEKHQQVRDCYKKAEEMGFKKLHGRYSHGKRVYEVPGSKDLVTPDVDSHSGGRWKLIDKATGRETLDIDFNKIGD